MPSAVASSSHTWLLLRFIDKLFFHLKGLVGRVAHTAADTDGAVVTKIAPDFPMIIGVSVLEVIDNGRLREVKEDSDCTQEQVATALKITRQQYQLYESSKENNRKIRIDLLKKNFIVFCLF